MTTALSSSPRTVEVILGPDGGVTLPASTLQTLGVQEGDRLTLSVSDGGLIVTPNKVLARQALEEIRRDLAASGITEEELQEEGRRVREELFRSRYGDL